MDTIVKSTNFPEGYNNKLSDLQNNSKSSKVKLKPSTSNNFQDKKDEDSLKKRKNIVNQRRITG